MKRKPKLGKAVSMLNLLTTQDQLSRIFRIHNLLNDKQPVNSSRLKAEIGNYSRRTFLRDLAFMTYSLNLPIEYDSSRKTYYYTQSVHQLPFLTLSPAEMQSLATGRVMLTQFVGSSIAEKMQSAITKIQRLVGATALLPATKTATVKVVGAVRQDLQCLDELEAAMLARQTVQFTYRKTGQDETTRETRMVDPHHCAFNKGRWYLIGFDRKRAGLRTFALTRIENLKVLKQTFQRQPGFDADQHFANTFGIIKGNGDYHVEIEFDRWGADLLAGNVWHDSQKTNSLPNGHIRMKLHLNSLDELTNWVMSWGEHATVIAPVELRDRVWQISRKLVERYQTTTH